MTFLTQFYPPEMGAPPARISEFAKGLARRGWDVDVVTALPNYPTGRIFPEYAGKRYVEEQIDGIPVKRTWIRPDASGRVAARLVAALSFALSAALACARSGKKGGVLVTESPPLTLPPAGIFAARRMGSTFVLNVSDLWPLSLVEMGVLRNRRLIRIAEAVEARSYRAARLITAQAPDIVANIRARFPDRRVELLSNGVDTQRFGPHLRSEGVRRELGLGAESVLAIFAGLHGLAQGLDCVIEAAHLLRDVSGLRFLFVGDGPAKSAAMEQTQRLGLTGVQFLPPAPRDRIAVLLASADIALVTLSRPLLGAVPSKVYEGMASGIPVVSATGGGADQFVEEAGAGLVAEPGNAASIAGAIRCLAQDKELRTTCGAAGRRLACERFERTIWIDRLSEYLEAVITSPG